MKYVLCAAVLLLASATTVLGASVPPVSFTQATIPASLLGPETDLDCLTAAEQSGSAVTASVVCYDWTGPSLHLKDITGTVSQGVLVLPIWDCVELALGFRASLAMAVDLATGAGMTILVQDLTAPLTCTGSALYGALTMTALPQDHDEDGDGCSDRNELYSDRDPFDPSDCGTGGTGVGGIAEMPVLVASTGTERAWLTAWGAFVAAVAMTVGYILGRIDERRKR